MKKKTDPPVQPCVLVVDDEPGFRDFLKWELSNLGLNVKTARDGKEAIRLVGKEKTVLVITDITMPKLNGLELLEKLKRKNPEIEVMILTGFGSVETSVWAMKNGARDFMLKPFDLDIFIKAVKEILERLKKNKAEEPHG